MKVRLPIWDARELASILQSAAHIETTCSITNGGLPKFEKKWAAMNDAEKRSLLDDIKRLACIVGSLGRAKVKIEAEVVERSK
jgi:hypothetical protein